MATDKKRSTISSHILKYTGLLGGVQALYVLLSIVRNKFTAELIGAVGLGLIDLYTRATTLMGSLTSMGINMSAVRQLSAIKAEKGDEEAKQYVGIVRSWVFVTALLGALATIIASPMLSLMLTKNYDHILEFCLLAPVVAFTTIASGETAILKGVHQLGRLAYVTAAGAIALLCIAVPLYWIAGLGGIIPVLLLSTGAAMVISLRATHRHYPYRINLFSPEFKAEGRRLLTMGIAFMAAGAVASGAEMLVRAFIVQQSGLSESGYYAAGFTITVSYARLVFMAMDADYFPRLTAAHTNRRESNNIANRQIDILVLLIAPFLIFFALMLPILVPLLYKAEFTIVIPMVLCALFYMFFKAIYSPIAYYSLAHANSRLFLTMEVAYNVVFVAAICIGYHKWGLLGAGIGLSVANLFDMLNVSIVYAWRYKFRFEWGTLQRIGIQFALLTAGIAASWHTPWAVRLTVGLPIFLLSAAYSWRLLQHETQLTEKLRSMLHKK